MAKNYSDIYYQSPDGLELYARDYVPGRSDTTLLCMHGLTRNSADFDALAQKFAGEYRIISVDQRGRGRSTYDPNPDNYRPDIYCGDMFALIAHLNLKNIIAIGTSMGGLMTMMMAAMQPGVFKAAIINDIGPVIDPAGLERIRGYVGGGGPFASWADAANALKNQGPDVFPLYTQDDWLAFAKRTCIENPGSQIELAYDKAIADGVKTQDPSAVPPDLWPAFEALMPIPLLVVRGALSDILSRDTISEMQNRHSGCTIVEIDNVGHAPMLDEPQSLAAIDDFLKVCQISTTGN
jgi:pimeloyl-ACP methyl ester carboxylesterase